MRGIFHRIESTATDLGMDICVKSFNQKYSLSLSKELIIQPLVFIQQNYYLCPVQFYFYIGIAILQYQSDESSAYQPLLQQSTDNLRSVVIIQDSRFLLYRSKLFLCKLLSLSLSKNKSSLSIKPFLARNRSRGKLQPRKAGHKIWMLR